MYKVPLSHTHYIITRRNFSRVASRCCQEVSNPIFYKYHEVLGITKLTPFEFHTCASLQTNSDRRVVILTTKCWIYMFNFKSTLEHSHPWMQKNIHFVSSKHHLAPQFFFYIPTWQYTPHPKLYFTIHYVRHIMAKVAQTNYRLM